MIWPFSASNKTPALPEAPAIPTIERVLATLERFKRDLLALNFIHVDKRDANTRGTILASIERCTELACSVDWTVEGGASRARSLKERLRAVVAEAQGLELASSFSATLADARSYSTNPFWVLNLYYKEMKSMPAAPAPFVPPMPIEAPVAQVTFPDCSALGDAFKIELEELAAQWQVRADQELTFEDRYLLEALATSYLPDSIGLYTSLSKDPAFAAQASEMFKQQLVLFTERIAAIEDATAKRQMQAMEVHNAFLKERLRAEPAPAERLSIAR